MITREEFVSKCTKILKEYLPEPVVASTISEMEKLKLSPLKLSQPVQENLVEECVRVIFTRMILFKGDSTAEEFLTKIDKWRYPR
jgi:hypothetical protein